MSILLKRISDLEKENANLDYMLEMCNGKIEKLKAENKRLREALEFYAELDGNGIQLYGDMDSNALEFVDGDSQIFGTIAKDALKGNEK